MSIILADRPFGSAEHISNEHHWFYLEQPYLNFLQHLYENGVDKADRTGTGTRSYFGYIMKFNLQRGIPIPTTKQMPQKTIFDELKWFLEGSTNNNRLREINQMHSKLDWSKKDTIWEEWADKNTGELGPIYSEQWRNFNGMPRIFATAQKAIEAGCIPKIDFAWHGEAGVIAVERVDQITEAINLLKNSPDSRRILFTAWNPSQTKLMALPPCHVLFQMYSRPATWQERRNNLNKYHGHIGHDCEITHEYMDEFKIPRRVLDSMLYQRSADAFLGVPFNIVSYSMLTEMFAQQADMIAGTFTWIGGDCHIYSNHFEQVKEQLSREPKSKAPQLYFTNKPNSIFEYDWKDIIIRDYECHPAIAAPVAV